MFKTAGFFPLNCHIILSHSTGLYTVVLKFKFTVSFLLADIRGGL